ncbi:tRNA (adenosine(37)-N6)-dimethylallyltransferase MiaA [Candidatus Trichorickettsia mobilis]|uniref:tRNA (adenosine(37)-N6)-dimethylallyltransferase MiaA n=1 Tax=Candidatus Trichorickettsia mobilis TaxID=1346319 RepID=UPI00292F160C|nr:tRNA (adenosine(37)-N6)-dimethylallyltransferase MiaA [Candidatus Trichorickettsia mobilis]
MNMVVIVCGPTGCGKTYFAHKLAQKYHGEIICADSMQLYQQIPIITASPADSLKKDLPYLLYNFLDINEESYSAVKYAEIAAQVIKEVNSRNKIPIVVGGSGLYINTLIFGYSSIPAISEIIKSEVKMLHEEYGQVKFFEDLQNLDPIAASKLNMLDKQRTMRAYEVYKQTGQSIITFQNNTAIAPLNGLVIKVILLNPERNFLVSSCNVRLQQMFDHGAVAEVEAIKRLIKNKSSIKDSSIKAVGVQEIIEYLDGQITLAEALNLAQCRTRQYAKRQSTWFRHQMKEKIILEYSSNKELEQLLLREEVVQIFD